MMIHLPGGQTDALPESPGTWVVLDALVTSGFEVKELGDDRIGLCPDPDRCVPVSASQRRGDAVDLEPLAPALGLVVASDGHHAVVRWAPGGDASHLRAGDQLSLELPDLDGDVRPVVAPHGRMAVFAWASW